MLITLTKPNKEPCATCPYNSCTYVKGSGKAGGIMLVGEAPGPEELKVRVPFIGKSGKLLTKVLKEVGIDRDNVWITNTVKCMCDPMETPKAKTIKLCAQYLWEEIKQVNPQLIVTLGRVPASALTKVKALGRERGSLHYTPTGIPIVVTYHPAYILRNPVAIRELRKDLQFASDYTKQRAEITYQPIQWQRVRPEDTSALITKYQPEHYSAVAYDVETFSRDNTLLCLGLSFEEGKAHVLDPNSVSWYATQLTQLFKNKDCIAHNKAFDYNVLRKYGVVMGKTVDTMLQSYILNGTVSAEVKSIHGLKRLVREELRIFDDYTKDIDPYYPTELHKAPLEVLYNYNAHDAGYTYLLHQAHSAKLTEQNNTYLEEILYPALEVVTEMENNGIKVDVPLLQEMQQELTEETNYLQRRARWLTGVDINLKSSGQMLWLLYEKLQLPVPMLSKKGTLTASREAINILLDFYPNHPILNLLLAYRDKEKMLGTFVKRFLLDRDAQDRIHCNFNLNATATGRMSASNPNLQQVSRGSLRNAFIATPNYKLINGDMAQAEIYGWAYLSGDQVLIDILRSGMDMHKSTASLMFNLKLEDVTKSQRTAAKCLSFGSVYGMSALRLARILKCNVIEAEELQEQFFRAYPQATAWLKETPQQIKNNNGIYTTIFGKELRFDIEGSFEEMKKKMTNYPVQNLANEVTMQAAVKFNELIKAGKLGDTRILLMVHDSIVPETREDVKAVGEELRKCMEYEYIPGFPLRADVECGPSWGTLTPI